jgi:hypothetical protein
MTEPFPLGPDEPGVAVAGTSASVAVAVTPPPALDPAQRSARLYNIGIAVVFSLMLIVLVVVGVMLWSK